MIFLQDDWDCAFLCIQLLNQKPSYQQNQLLIYNIYSSYRFLSINYIVEVIKIAGKILFLVLGLLFIGLNALSLKHETLPETCLYLPAGNLFAQKTFNYTIIKAWTPEQSTQLQNGILNTSDFIRVEGWGPKRNQNKLYYLIKEKTSGIKDELTFVKNVSKASDAPEFGLADQDIQLGFGNPSKGILTKVPQGKALLSFNCQLVSYSQQLGQWSVIIGLADMKNLQSQHKKAAQMFQREIRLNHLTSQEFLFNANIQAPIVENSLFYTFKTSPAAGIFGLIKYECYVYAIREEEEILLGPLNKEQQEVFQIMDLVKNRTSCK